MAGPAAPSLPHQTRDFRASHLTGTASANESAGFLPNHTGVCWNNVAASDVASAISDDYLRCFVKNGRRYGHIIDPRAGKPLN